MMMTGLNPKCVIHAKNDESMIANMNFKYVPDWNGSSSIDT